MTDPAAPQHDRRNRTGRAPPRSARPRHNRLTVTFNALPRHATPRHTWHRPAPPSPALFPQTILDNLVATERPVLLRPEVADAHPVAGVSGDVYDDLRIADQFAVELDGERRAPLVETRARPDDALALHDRPALIDEGFRGGLASSMTYKPIDSTSFQVGTNKPYAAKQFYGGMSRQPITEQVQTGIRKFLDKKGDPAKGLTKKGSPYEDKLKPLLRKRVLTTVVGSRPFVGIFAELWKDILQAIQEHFDRYAGSGEGVRNL